MSALKEIADVIGGTFVEAKVASKDALVEVYDSKGKLIKDKEFLEKYNSFLKLNKKITPVNIVRGGDKGRTCMFFPFGYQTKRLITPSGDPISKDDLWSIMRATKGGFKGSGSSGVNFRGFATCRKCGKANGSRTGSLLRHAVPEGITHYIKDHKIPGNFFSVGIEEYSVYYVASKPAVLK